MTKEDPHMYGLQETHFRFKDTDRKGGDGRKYVMHENENKSEVAVLISDKLELKERLKNTRQSRTLPNDKGINPTRYIPVIKSNRNMYSSYKKIMYSIVNIASNIVITLYGNIVTRLIVVIVL